MKTILFWCASALVLTAVSFAAPKQHVVALGKWTTVKWMLGGNENTSLDLKIRPLLVDGRAKEFVIGAVHDVTERTFVAQRAYRLNDSLPQETGPTRWRWERGGWILVDRTTGKVQTITLPDFDAFQSSVIWFRDYAAYCGTSDDGTKLLAMVFQLGKRKPLLKKSIADVSESNTPDSECASPVWQRAPARVTFEPANSQKFTYSVRTRAVDTVSDDAEGEE